MKQVFLILIGTLQVVLADAQCDSTKFLGNWQLDDAPENQQLYARQCNRRFAIPSSFQLLPDTLHVGFSCDTVPFKVIPYKWQVDLDAGFVTKRTVVDSMELILEAFTAYKKRRDGTVIDYSDSLLLGAIKPNDRSLFIQRDLYTGIIPCTNDELHTLRLRFWDNGKTFYLTYNKVE